MYKLKIIFALSILLQFSESLFLPCKLEWRRQAFGDEGNSVNVVSIFKGLGIARSGGSAVETYKIEEDYASINGTKLFIYEVLSNPHKCNYGWELSSEKPIWKDENRYFVKHFGETGEISVSQIPAVQTHSDLLILTSHQIKFNVQTHRKLLHLKPTSFEQKDLTLEFLGYDQIINETPAEILQVVEHSKEVAEEVRVTDSEGTAHTVFDYSKFIEFPITDGSGSSNTTTTLQENSVITRSRSLVSSRREVRVMGHAKIQVCSTVSIIEQPFETLLEVNVSLPGFNGKDVADLFTALKLPYPIKSIEEYHVMSEIRLMSQRKLVSNTNTIVIDPAITNCTVIAESVNAWNQFKMTRDERVLLPYKSVLKYVLPIPYNYNKEN